ncbi:mRNA-capping enzyme subunit beta [Xylographa opegraphella]|nr:mRNA-capping enzyme subunit beta [Xylographa opegraphella]
MDLASIINSDSTTNPSPTSRLSSKLESPAKHIYPNHPPPYRASLDGPLQGHQEAHPNQRAPQPAPLQPPPLQPPSHQDLQSPHGSQSQHSAQSPYHGPSTPIAGGGRYIFPQPPGHGQVLNTHGAPYQPRDQTTTILVPNSQAYGQPSSSVSTPTSTTPGNSYPYPQFQRPQSSHSSATPTSAQSHVQQFSRDSPRLVRTQVNAQVQSYNNQQYQSQPGTPLGPPPSTGRPSPILHRESSGPYQYENYRSQSVSSYGHAYVPLPSPTTETPTILASPASYSTRQPPSRSRSYMTDEERERSLSVSPKTRLPSQTKVEALEVTPETDRRWSGGVTPVKRKMTDSLPDTKPISDSDDNHAHHELQFSHGSENRDLPDQHSNVGMALKDKAYVPGPQHIKLSSTVDSNMVPPHFEREADHPVSRDNQYSVSAAVTPSRQQPTTPQVPSNHRTPASQISRTPPSAGFVNPSLSASQPPNSAKPQMMETSNTTQRTAKRRQRFTSPPIFARSWRAMQNGNGNQLRTTGKPATLRTPPHAKSEKLETKGHGSYNTADLSKEDGNGHITPVSEVKVMKTEPLDLNDEALGPWEYNIVNILPNEELTRIVADFLFAEVVNRKDIGTGPAGAGFGSGAVLEVEAKLGQLVDKNTNDRLRLPVMTECVISKNDPNLRVMFKSSMTESQHQSLNRFLNEAYIASLPPPSQATSPSAKPRIPMNYIHTKECDTFYELSQAAELTLPPSIRAQINPRHNKAKVRVTTDQKTGRVLARIIKVRVADLDVYNPGTPFDWRVSVNLEMNFTGDMGELVEVMEGGKRAPERNKDRMTYKHLAYQIDLTQVKSAEVVHSAEKEHELEIELASDELRKHGNLLQLGQINGYETLIKGFINNVRVLTRHFAVR